MERNQSAGPREKNSDLNFNSQPEASRERDGGDDALADSSPTDIHSDEKVIVNAQRENKTVNAPSQTAANTSEGNSYDDDIIDQAQQ